MRNEGQHPPTGVLFHLRHLVRLGPVWHRVQIGADRFPAESGTHLDMDARGCPDCLVDQLQQTTAWRLSATCLKEEGALVTRDCAIEHGISHDTLDQSSSPISSLERQNHQRRVICTFQKSSPLDDCGTADQPAPDTLTPILNWRSEILPLLGTDTQILPVLRRDLKAVGSYCRKSCWLAA